MGIFFDAPVAPDALTAFVREVPVPATLGLSNAFPTRAVDDNKVDFNDLVHTNRTAKFRPFDGRISTMGRDSASRSEVSLIPLSNSSSAIGEFERLQLQFARTGGTNTAALAAAIYNDAQNLVESVRNRIELAWGDVLVDGKLTINEQGYQGEADFGVPAEHIVTAAKVWTDPTATILTDLFNWSDVYVNTNGVAPGQIVTSTKQVRAMLKNTEIVNAVYGSNGGRTRITLPEVNDLLSSNGLPTVAAPYDLRLDVDGADTRVIADNKVLLLPATMADLGYTVYGVTATALELVDSAVSDLSFADAPGIVGVVEKVGPPYRQFTFVDAVALPILERPKRLFVATA